MIFIDDQPKENPNEMIHCLIYSFISFFVDILKSIRRCFNCEIFGKQRSIENPDENCLYEDSVLNFSCIYFRAYAEGMVWFSSKVLIDN